MTFNAFSEVKNASNSDFWQQYRVQVLAAPIFFGIDEQDVLKAMHFLQASWRRYAKEDLIIKSGDKIDRIGLLLSGNIEISRQDIMGNQFILTHLNAPNLFAEVLACAALDTSPVTIKSLSDTVVLMLNFGNILQNQDETNAYGEKIISNVLKLLARKNLMLNEKLDIMSKRSLRSRITAMLLAAASRSGQEKFILPYNRQEMADYLAVDRSSLSRELSRMQKEGLLRFCRQTFEILQFSVLARKV